MTTPVYEFIYKQYAHRCFPIVGYNFNEWDDGEDCNFRVFESRVRTYVRAENSSGRITEYKIDMFNPHTDALEVKVVYHSYFTEFQPESVKYFEPTWQEFTDDQLKRALEYLTPKVNMNFDEDRSLYKLLVFKDKFHLAMQTKHKYEDLYHTLCITAYDIDITS